MEGEAEGGAVAMRSRKVTWWSELPKATVRQCFGVDLVIGRSSQDFAKGANLSFHAAYSSFPSIQAERAQLGSLFSVPCCFGLLQV